VRVILALLLLLLPVVLLARDVPFLSGRIVDEAGMLSPEARQRIEQKLAGFEQRTGAQVVVLTIDSLQGDPIEDFAIRVAETWKLGQQGKDNGAIFLVARDDRLMRIEVGYGLEPELTDAESGRILDNIVRPAFRNGDFGGGIEQGVDAVLAALGGAEVAAEPAMPAVPVPTHVPAGFKLILFFVLATFSLVAVTAGGCQSWFLYVFLMPFYLFFGGALFSELSGLFIFAPLIAWVVLFPILKAFFGRKGGPRRSWPRGGGWVSGGGPFIGGGGFGGGFGGGRGGGFGGGGFSGGGGRFGGGGASGSW
jgi:uncharacterized protein